MFQFEVYFISICILNPQVFMSFGKTCLFRHNICPLHSTYPSTICTSPAIRRDTLQRASDKSRTAGQVCFFISFFVGTSAARNVLKSCSSDGIRGVGSRLPRFFDDNAFGRRTALSSVRFGGVREAIHQLNRVLQNAPRISIIGFRSSEEKAI